MRTVLNISSAIGLILWLSSSATAAQLSAPFRRTTYVEAYATGNNVPKWSGDYLISWKSGLSASDGRDNLILYGRNGEVVQRQRLWFDDAAFVWIRDAAASAGNGIAVVGNAMTPSGSVAGFLAYISPGKPTAVVIQTSPFEGQKVAFGPDGTTWVLGYQPGEGRTVKTAPEHAIVQHYNASGKLLSQHLPWSEFKCGTHPALTDHGSVPQLVASKSRIGVLLPACREWVELSTSGALVGRWPVRDPFPGHSASENAVWTLSMTSTDRIIARIGLTLFSLRRDDGVWVPLSLPDGTHETIGGLAGTDGDAVVYRVRQELLWVKLVE